MLSFKPRVFASLLLIGSLFVSCRPSDLDLDQVITRHAEARGGAAALEAVERVRVELHLTEADFEVDIVYQAMRPDQARVDVQMDGQTVFTEAYDGSVAWQQSGAGSPPSRNNAEGTAALRRGAIGNLHGLHELRALGHQLALLERTDIDGVRYYPVRVTYDDGHEEHFYIDPDTFLTARQRQVHALHPDVDLTEIWKEDQLSDYRNVDGVLHSFQETSLDLNTGDVVQRTEIRHIEINPPLDPTLFKMPQVENEGD